MLKDADLKKQLEVWPYINLAGGNVLKNIEPLILSFK